MVARSLGLTDPAVHYHFPSKHALYLAVLSAIGPVALAVTINFNINFLRRPEQRDIIADARIMKLGKRLAVMDVMLFSDGVDEPIAHVTSTYSIPPITGG